MSARIRAWAKRLEKYAESWWYPLVVAVLAAADAYIFVVPIEVLLVPAVLAHRKRWFLTALWVTLGSALGAASFAGLASFYGPAFVHKILPDVMHERAWRDSTAFLQRHGDWSLALVSLSPFPQHAAVAIAGLARMNIMTVLFSVFAGRFVKYEVLAWLAVHAPGLLKKLHGAPKS